MYLTQFCNMGVKAEPHSVADYSNIVSLLTLLITSILSCANCIKKHHMFENISVKLLQLKIANILNILVLCIVILMGVGSSHSSKFIFLCNLTLNHHNVRLL